MPGFKDFVTGATLPESDLDDYLGKQVVMKFASAAARDSALAAVLREGMVAYLDDVNTVTVYSGAAWSTVGPVHGAWTAYTSTWSGTLGNGILGGAYMRVGRMITFRIDLTWGSTTSHAAASQTFTAPVAAVTNSHNATAEAFVAGATYVARSASTSSTVFNMATTSSLALWANTSPATWGASATAKSYGTYEAAADA